MLHDAAHIAWTRQLKEEEDEVKEKAPPRSMHDFQLYIIKFYNLLFNTNTESRYTVLLALTSTAHALIFLFKIQKLFYHQNVGIWFLYRIRKCSSNPSENLNLLNGIFLCKLFQAVLAD